MQPESQAKVLLARILPTGMTIDAHAEAAEAGLFVAALHPQQVRRQQLGKPMCNNSHVYLSEPCEKPSRAAVDVFNETL